MAPPPRSFSLSTYPAGGTSSPASGPEFRAQGIFVSPMAVCRSLLYTLADLGLNVYALLPLDWCMNEHGTIEERSSLKWIKVMKVQRKMRGQKVTAYSYCGVMLGPRILLLNCPRIRPGPQPTGGRSYGVVRRRRELLSDVSLEATNHHLIRLQLAAVFRISDIVQRASTHQTVLSEVLSTHTCTSSSPSRVSKTTTYRVLTEKAGMTPDLQTSTRARPRRRHCRLYRHTQQYS